MMASPVGQLPVKSFHVNARIEKQGPARNISAGPVAAYAGEAAS